MSKYFIPVPRAYGNYDTAAVSDDNGLFCPEPTLTQQQFKDDNDPNVVMQKFARTEDMTLFQQRSPRYGDFTGPNSYHDALNVVRAADSAFYALPARIRNRFQNDPAQFADFLSDDDNFDEAKELGLLRPGATKMSDAPLPEDLSTVGERPSTGHAKPTVGKSGDEGKPSPRASKGDLKGGD